MAALNLAAEPITRQLERDGTLLLLQGDFAAASKIQAQLLEDYNDPVGHIFALNTLITHLTWDETNRSFDQALQHHAEQTIQWCHDKTILARDPARAHYYCGQAHFALSYFHALKGNYFQAGRHGTECIEHLELALAEKPDLVDAKMHLGVAYYVADNLPPFIKMFSRVLWFIPTGNSRKSLPYLREVINHGDHYNDVARYSYSNLLLDDPARFDEAVTQLQTLTNRYPSNRRFQLRFISALMIRESYAEALAAIQSYLQTAETPSVMDQGLVKIWQVRAHLGLNQLAEAKAVFNDVDSFMDASGDDLPDWSVAWHLLNRANMLDLAERRTEARAAYNNILNIAKSGYVSDVIQEAAKAGLNRPFQLSGH